MKIEIATSGGIFRTIEAEETRAAGVLLHESFRGDNTWTLTHRWTGMCFFSLLPSRRHAELFAAVLGAVANWDVRTYEGTMGVFANLPEYWRKWIIERQKELTTRSSEADPDGLKRALRRLRNRARVRRHS